MVKRNTVKISDTNKQKKGIFLKPDFVFYSYFFFIVAGVLLIDQITKYFAQYKHIVIISGLFEIKYSQNPGIVFGLFANNKIFVILLPLLIICFFTYLYFREARRHILLKIGMPLIVAGLLGNLVDRFTRGFVTDFIFFMIKPEHNISNFNIADSSLIIGVILVIIYLSWFEGKEEKQTSENKKQKKKQNKKRNKSVSIFVIFLIIIVMGIAGCDDKKDSEQTNTLNEKSQDSTAIETQTPAPKGEFSIDVSFTPQVGKYQSTAVGTINVKAPIENCKVEVYTKTNKEKKVVAAVKLGNISEDKTIDLEISLAKNTVTYKIAGEGGIMPTILPENQNHALGVDVTADGISANWESGEFSFDDDDAYKVAAK